MTFDEVLGKANKHLEATAGDLERFCFDITLDLKDHGRVYLRKCFVEHGPDYTTVYSRQLLAPFICLTEDITDYSSEPTKLDRSIHDKT
jgi:hypothetical protein